MDDYTKRQVEIWNNDVETHGGYLYSTNPPYSARVALARMSREIHRAIPHATKTIIDFGCGDGMYTQELAEAFPAAQIIGLDPARGAIEYAQQKWPSIDFRVADILDSPSLPDVMADVGIIRAVLHHLPDESQNFAVHNASKRCRRLIILEPNGNNPVVKLFEKYSAYHIHHEEKSFTSTELLSWCNNAQWQQVSHVYIGFVPTFFPEGPARFAHFVQPLFEKIPFINTYLSAQIVIVCSNTAE